jgi:hypothetical protein
MEVFKGHSSFIFQKKPKGHNNIVEIFDSRMRLLASCKRKRVWKSPDGPFKINKQAYSSDIFLEDFSGRILGEINEIPPQMFSMRLIRRYKIYDDDTRLIGVVREKPKAFGSTWVLFDRNEENLIGEIVGNRKKKNYKIESSRDEVLVKCYRDSSLDSNSYRVDTFVGWDRLFLVLCYVLVLDLAKTVFVTRSGWFSSKPLIKMKPKTALGIGCGLIVAGFCVWVLGILINYVPYESFTNGYHYIDVIAIFSGLPIFFGFVIILLLYLPNRLYEEW